MPGNGHRAAIFVSFSCMRGTLRPRITAMSPLPLPILTLRYFGSEWMSLLEIRIFLTMASPCRFWPKFCSGKGPLPFSSKRI